MATDRGGDDSCSSDRISQKQDLPIVTADTDVTPAVPPSAEGEGKIRSDRLLSRDELIQQLLSISPVPQGQVTTVGMVRMYEML